jgi:ribosomal protein S18 acetylase RimI-like enzyme
VFHRFQRNGLGTLLVNEALATARRNGVAELFLKVMKQNHTAINFYLRAGFRVATEERLQIGGYDSDVEIVVMRLALSSPNAKADEDAVGRLFDGPT